MVLDFHLRDLVSDISQLILKVCQLFPESLLLFHRVISHLLKGILLGLDLVEERVLVTASAHITQLGAEGILELVEPLRSCVLVLIMSFTNL